MQKTQPSAGMERCFVQLATKAKIETITLTNKKGKCIHKIKEK